MASESRRKTSRDASLRIAFCGMATALSLTLMLTGAMLSVATYAVPMFCGFLLLPVVMEFGRKAGWLVWLGVSLLSVFIGANKEAALFYLFLGCWPLLKMRFDHIRNRGLCLAAKIAYFTAAFAALYGLLCLIINAGAALREFREMGPWVFAGFCVIYLVCMLLYDRLVLPMSVLYLQRIRPRLRIGGK